MRSEPFDDIPPDMDHPPKGMSNSEEKAEAAEQKLEDQIAMFKGDQPEPDEVRRSRIHLIELSIIVKSETDKGAKISLLQAESPAERIFELLELAIKSRRNRAILRAVLDLPEGN